MLRYLKHDERNLVAPIFSEFGCVPPNNGKLLINEEQGKLIGLQCFHQVWHAGPVWVHPEHRGQGKWQEMQKKLEADMKPGTYFYQFGTAENEQRLKELGLTSLGWTVWGKRV